MRPTLLAYFDRPEEAVEAVRLLLERGHERLDVLSPFRLEELDGLLPTRPWRISAVVFTGAALGSASAYGLQFLTAVKLYPFRVASTPLHAWPSFLPITFEAGVLLAAISSLLGLVLLCGLPRYHHPVFDLPEVERTSLDRYAVLVETEVPETVRELLLTRFPEVGLYAV